MLQIFPLYNAQYQTPPAVYIDMVACCHVYACAVLTPDCMRRLQRTRLHGNPWLLSRHALLLASTASIMPPACDQTRCLMLLSQTVASTMQRLARSSTIGEYSRSLSDVSKWSRSVSSIDEAQLDMMRKHMNGQPSKVHSNRTTATKDRASHESRHEM